MVPYVRKSFWKYIKKGAKYFVPEIEISYITENLLGDLDLTKAPIEAYDNPTTSWEGSQAVCCIINSYKKLYDYAME